MIKLISITKNIELAKRVVNCGVGRIFIDLEILGKRERQAHRDTLISDHSIADVRNMRKALPDTELLVRCNPMYSDTRREVEEIIEAGADLIMLPMFRTSKELHEFSGMVDDRVGIVPLVETRDAANNLSDIVKVSGVTEIYIGLNDLHIELNMSFMFEPLVNGMLDEMVAIISETGLPFGFGGVARMDEGLLSGQSVLGEHLRLGSTRVILSRTFHRLTDSADTEEAGKMFEAEIKRLRKTEQILLNRSENEIANDHLKVVSLIRQVVPG